MLNGKTCLVDVVSQINQNVAPKLLAHVSEQYFNAFNTFYVIEFSHVVLLIEKPNPISN